MGWEKFIARYRTGTASLPIAGDGSADQGPEPGPVPSIDVDVPIPSAPSPSTSGPVARISPQALAALDDEALWSRLVQVADRRVELERICESPELTSLRREMRWACDHRPIVFDRLMTPYPASPQRRSVSTAAAAGSEKLSSGRGVDRHPGSQKVTSAPRQNPTFVEVF